MKTIVPNITLIFLLTIIAFVGWVNFDAVTFAFGDGSPYYSRTTNMDKWENPLLPLIILDIITIFILYCIKQRRYKT